MNHFKKRIPYLLMFVILCSVFTVYASATTIPAGGSIWTPSPEPTPDVPDTYSVIVKPAENGKVQVNTSRAEYGQTVTITVTPDEGYELDELVVVDYKDNELRVTDKGNGKFTFQMPVGKATVEAFFEKSETVKAENSFYDVKTSDYFYNAVLWAADNGITNGVTPDSFAPGAICNRAQVVTFLWRAAGCPAPKSSTMPFTDVPAGAYYYNAVLWAVENGITNGVSDTQFAPGATVTRGQTVTFLWRAEKGGAAEIPNVFQDVAAGAYYYNAVLWAVENGITNGISDTKFAPNNGCTRGQIVTFLYRNFID